MLKAKKHSKFHPFLLLGYYEMTYECFKGRSATLKGIKLFCSLLTPEILEERDEISIDSL